MAAPDVGDLRWALGFPSTSTRAAYVHRSSARADTRACQPAARTHAAGRRPAARFVIVFGGGGGALVVAAVDKRGPDAARQDARRPLAASMGPPAPPSRPDGPSRPTSLPVRAPARNAARSAAGGPAPPTGGTGCCRFGVGFGGAERCLFR